MPLFSYHLIESLERHARVALVAPSGPLRDADDLERAIHNVRSFGWEAVPGQNVLARDGYLAGHDALRLHDLNSALQDSTIDAVWCVRGGYGLIRLLDDIDYDAIIRHPKPLIGFSDITALHAAVGKRCEIVTYHGPTARADLTEFSRHSFEQALVTHTDPCGIAESARILYPGQTTGRLMGGNLALLASLAGSSFFPDLSDAILLLEDVGERTYRIDRMLHQLFLTGALNHIRALGFGQFTECDDATEEFSLHRLLQEFADLLAVPCLADLPMGHIDDQWTIPFGALATFDADARSLTVLPSGVS